MSGPHPRFVDYAVWQDDAVPRVPRPQPPLQQQHAVPQHAAPQPPFNLRMPLIPPEDVGRTSLIFLW